MCNQGFFLKKMYTPGNSNLGNLMQDETMVKPLPWGQLVILLLGKKKL